MLVQELRDAIGRAHVRPKAVKIGPDMWNELKSAHLIEYKPATAFGAFTLGFDLPCYEDVILIYDPEIDARGLSFELPPNAA